MSLRELRSANWGDGGGVRRARVSADGRGVFALIYGGPDERTRPPVYLTYREIATHVRAVSAHEGRWTVHLGGAGHDFVELEFTSDRAVRLFLDGATALSGGPRLAQAR